jgi:hypothetical protein
MKGIMKWPLLIALAVVVVRVLLEQIGVPETTTNYVSAVALHLLIFPLYFAVRIGGSHLPHPYTTLLKTIAVYSLLVRAMIMVTYWLAYFFQWPQSRFSVAAGGVVGEGIGPLQALVIRPVVAALAWVVGSVIVGGLLGSIVIAVRRRMVASPLSS